MYRDSSFATIYRALHRWTNTLEVRFVAGKTAVSWVRNEVPTGSYSILNFRTAYIWRKEAASRPSSTGSTTCRWAEPISGRAGPWAELTFQWGVSVPGMGRSLYVATNVKF
jgi:iron complex outermembrane recepter protein